MKIIKEQRDFINDKKESIKYTAFVVVLDSGERVTIKPITKVGKYILSHSNEIK